MFHIPISRIPLLQDPPFVLYLVLLGSALGRRVLGLLSLPLGEASRLERGVLCAATGLGLLQYIPFGLGVIGHLTPLSVKACLLVLTLLLLPDLYRLICTLLHVLRQRRKTFSWSSLVPGTESTRLSGVPPGVLRTRKLPEYLRRSVSVGVFLIALVPFLQALCPCTDPDGLGYHLRAPKLWLQSGRLGYLPTMVHANSPMGVEMLFTLALAAWSDTAAKLIHFAFGVLSLLAVYALGRRVHSAKIGAWATAAFALGVPGTPVLALSAYAYIDLGLTLETVCAVLAWLWWRRTRSPAWLVCAALCAGFAFSFKLTGLLLVLTLAAATFWERHFHHRDTETQRFHRGQEGDKGAESFIRIQGVKGEKGFSFGNALLVLGIGLLPGLPWLARAWALTGDPVYPFLAQVFPTRDWSVAQGAVFDIFMRYYNWAGGHTNWGLGVRKLLIVAVMGIYGAGACLAWRFMGRKGDTEARALLLLTALPTLALFAGTGLYFRFLVPVLPLHLVLLFHCGLSAWGVPGVQNTRLSGLRPGVVGTRKPQVWRVLQVGLVLLFAGNGLLYLRSSTPKPGEALQVATGRISRDEYLNRQLSPMPLWTYANTRLPANARLLIVRFGGVYYCDRDCLILNGYYQQRIRLDTWEHFLADVQRERITYLVASPAYEGSVTFGPAYLPARNETMFSMRLARLYGQPLATAADLRLYCLRLPQQ